MEGYCNMAYYTLDQIEDIASDIRTTFNVPSDQYIIDITRLAEDADCKVYEVDFEGDEISGTFQRDGEAKILVNKNDSEQRKRFTIAHELSHGILHPTGDTQHIDYRQPLKYYAAEDLKKEVQANMLAAALLMPKDLVEKFWENCNDVDDLAEAFNVSRRAATIRLDTLGRL